MKPARNNYAFIDSQKMKKAAVRDFFHGITRPFVTPELHKWVWCVGCRNPFLIGVDSRTYHHSGLGIQARGSSSVRNSGVVWRKCSIIIEKQPC